METSSPVGMRTLVLLLVASVGFALASSPAPTHRSEPPPAVVSRNSDGSPKRLPPGPPEVPGHTLVLEYDELGPQAMSFGLIGMGWWQWSECACFEPGDAFDIRVVIYRGLELPEVEQRYPTVKDRADYRHVAYRDALAYLDANIADLAGDGELASLRAELQATRRRIVAALGS